MNSIVFWLVLDVVASGYFAYLLKTEERWRGINGFCLGLWLTGVIDRINDLLKLS